MASISSAVSVFLVPSHMVIYIVLPLLMKSDKIFKLLITVPLKGKTIKEQKSSKYFVFCAKTPRSLSVET